MKDLLVLTADQDAEFLLKTLLSRIPMVEDFPAITFDIIRHPQRDPGVAGKAIDFVRPYINDYRFVLIVFDHEGSGREFQSRESLESEIETLLAQNGWQKRSVCIVIEPEIETWLWVNKTHFHNITDWNYEAGVYTWLAENDFQFLTNSTKPERPKEAFEAILRKQRIPRSSSLYSKLAQQASYRQCTDTSFEKFIKTIKNWFSVT